ncbi:MAG: LysR family transcriptional regulator [Bacteroidales bacterium]|nr:LysR family transcriptional regulator [Bacteroidales bacterium]
MFEDTRLKVFMAVARTGSFTAAAREIGISQPAVSQNVAELEKEVGEPLFERQRGSVRLTDTGMAFMDYASRIIHWYGAMDSAFGPSARVSHPGPLIVSADSYCSDYLVPKLVTALRLSSPNLKFIINPYEKEDGGKDPEISFFVAEKPSEADLLNTATLCGTVQACAVSSSPSVQAQGYFPEGMLLAVWEPYFKLVPDDIKALTVLVSESVPAVESAAASSEGIIGILPLHEGLNPSLKVLPFPLPDLQLDLHMEPSADFSTTDLFLKISSLLQSGII